MKETQNIYSSIKLYLFMRLLHQQKMNSLFNFICVKSIQMTLVLLILYFYFSTYLDIEKMEGFLVIAEMFYNFLLSKEKQTIVQNSAREQSRISQNKCYVSEKKKMSFQGLNLSEWLQSKFQAFIKKQYYQFEWTKVNNNTPQTDNNQKQHVRSSYLWQLLKEQKVLQTQNNRQFQGVSQKICLKTIQYNFYKFNVCYSNQTAGNQDKIEDSGQKQGSEVRIQVVKVKNNPKGQARQSNLYCQNDSMLYLAIKDTGPVNQLQSMTRCTRQIQSNVTIINPSIQVLNRLILGLTNPNTSFQTELSAGFGQVVIQRPKTIILTSASLKTLTSTVLILHSLYYFDWAEPGHVDLYDHPDSQQTNISNSDSQKNTEQIIRIIGLKNKNKDFIKIVTTKTIYAKYLSIVKFIRLMSQFHKKCAQLATQFTPQTQIQKNKEIKQIQREFVLFELQNELKIQNTVSFLLLNLHFRIVNSNQYFCYHNMQYCFRNSNLFPYKTYDLQLLDLQKGQLLTLIQGFSMKNVKNIYYAYKKQFISQNYYGDIVKRLEQKQNLFKNNPQVVTFKQNWAEMQRKQMNENTKAQIQIHSQYLCPKSNNIKAYKPSIKVTSLVSGKASNHNSEKLQSYKQTTNSNLLFRDPYQVSVQRKNLIFPQIRRIELFSLLADVELLSILNQGLLLQHYKNQVIHNSSMNLEHIFIFLSGVCLTGPQKQPEKHCYLQIGDIFGWQHYFLLKQPDSNGQSSQFKNFYNQKGKSVTAFSQEVLTLRVPFSFLEYVLFDKHEDLRGVYLKSMKKKNQLTQILRKQEFISQQTNQIKLKLDISLQSSFSDAKQFFVLLNKYENNEFSPQKSLDDLKDIQLKLLLINYPNFLLAF